MNHGQVQTLALSFITCLSLREVFNSFVPQLRVFLNCVEDYRNEYIYVLYKVPVIHSETQNLLP